LMTRLKCLSWSVILFEVMQFLMDVRVTVDEL